MNLSRLNIMINATSHRPQAPQSYDYDNLPTHQLDINELYRKIGSKIPTDWQRLGCYLGIPFSTMDKIRDNNPRNVDNCILTMLNTWDEMQSSEAVPPKYQGIDALLNGLRQIGKGRLASEIQKDLSLYLLQFPPKIGASQVNETPFLTQKKTALEKENIARQETVAELVVQLEMEKNKHQKQTELLQQKLKENTDKLSTAKEQIEKLRYQMFQLPPYDQQEYPHSSQIPDKVYLKIIPPEFQSTPLSKSSVS